MYLCAGLALHELRGHVGVVAGDWRVLVLLARLPAEAKVRELDCESMRILATTLEHHIACKCRHIWQSYPRVHGLRNSDQVLYQTHKVHSSW